VYTGIGSFNYWGKSVLHYSHIEGFVLVTDCLFNFFQLGLNVFPIGVGISLLVTDPLLGISNQGLARWQFRMVVPCPGKANCIINYIGISMQESVYIELHVRP
jgi:hypothetical protein